MISIKIRNDKHKECNLCGRRLGEIAEVKSERNFVVISLCRDCVEAMDGFFKEND